jgi:hypothetical protein
MAKLKYHLVVAQGYPAIDAAAKLDSKVNNLMEAGWEPSMPPGMFVGPLTDPGGRLDSEFYTAFQTLLWNPANQNPFTERRVTAGGGRGEDPVTPVDHEIQVFNRDTQLWKDAWAALEYEVGDISIWMYMSSKLINLGLSWEHSFKHIETRTYRTVTTPRQPQKEG